MNNHPTKVYIPLGFATNAFRFVTDRKPVFLVDVEKMKIFALTHSPTILFPS